MSKYMCNEAITSAMKQITSAMKQITSAIKQLRVQ